MKGIEINSGLNMALYSFDLKSENTIFEERMKLKTNSEMDYMT